MARLESKRIIVGVTAGIAAYKAADLVRRLMDEGAEVRVVMTPGATSFITPLTMQALSGHPVHTELIDTEAEAAMGHIELARWGDLLLIAPATADFLARMAAGLANDLLSTLYLATPAVTVIAPAMNQGMWRHEATQTNLRTLQGRGVVIIEPGVGSQACGDVGPGRLAEISDIVDQVADIISLGAEPTGALAGRKVVITAGPTREAIDPVRFISNHSSGKQGFALARAAKAAGATVILVAGPTGESTPEGVERIDVVSALDMHQAALAAGRDADVFIGVAAVADYRPAESATQKIKKRRDQESPGSEEMNIRLIENPDIIADVARLEPRPYVVGFAAETENLVPHARAKLERKGLDLVIANDVSDRSIGFNADQNRTTIICRDQEFDLPMMSKDAVAARIIEIISDRMRADA